MTLTCSVAASSSSVNSPIASRSPGILKASSRQVGLSGRPDASANQNSNPDAASSSQGWQRDAQLFFSTGKLVATDTDQNSLNRQEEPVSTGKLVAMVTTEHQGCSRKSKIPEDSGDSKPKSRIWPPHFHGYHQTCVYRKKDLWSETDRWYERPRCEHSDLVYMHVCHIIKAAVHLGPDNSHEFAIRQKSIFEVCGSIIPDVCDQLGRAHVERIVSVVW